MKNIMRQNDPTERNMKLFYIFQLRNKNRECDVRLVILLTISVRGGAFQEDSRVE